MPWLQSRSAQAIWLTGCGHQRASNEPARITHQSQGTGTQATVLPSAKLRVGLGAIAQPNRIALISFYWLLYSARVGIPPGPSGVFEFDKFKLDCDCFELRRRGRNLKLERKLLELLILLAEKKGHFLPRPSLRTSVDS